MTAPETFSIYNVRKLRARFRETMPNYLNALGKIGDLVDWSLALPHLAGQDARRLATVAQIQNLLHRFAKDANLIGEESIEQVFAKAPLFEAIAKSARALRAALEPHPYLVGELFEHIPPGGEYKEVRDGEFCDLIDTLETIAAISESKVARAAKFGRSSKKGPSLDKGIASLVQDLIAVWDHSGGKVQEYAKGPLARFLAAVMEKVLDQAPSEHQLRGWIRKAKSNPDAWSSNAKSKTDF